MSEYTSKVNRVLATLWGRIEEKRDTRKIPKYKNWISQVEKKASSIFSQLKYLSGTDPDRKDKLANIYYKLMSHAGDMNTLLLTTIFKYDPINGSANGSNGASERNNHNLDPIRNVLLELWATILTSLGRVDGEVQTTLYETILAIMCRQEFEVDQLTTTSVDIAIRYRDMLHATLDAIVPRTAESLGPGLTFASRVLAVLYWRLPQVKVTLLRTVTRDVNNDPVLLDGLLPLNKEDEEQNPMPTLTALKSWPALHKFISAETAIQNLVWADNIGKRELAYAVFFKEWILYTKSVLKPEPDFDWYTVPGFHALVSSLVFDLRTKEQPPAPVTRPYPLLELQYILMGETRGDIITSFIKAVFMRTSAYDMLIVMNTLSLLEAWLVELQRRHPLPESFDMEFFCRGLNILLDSDHHQTVLRVLQVIYNGADLFNGSFRYLLFGELIVKKMFFTLFLHWDPGVRNAFQQLIIFKVVRIKRSELYKDGFVVRELSRIQPKKQNSPEKPPSPLATITRTISHIASSTDASGEVSGSRTSDNCEMNVDAHLFLMINECLAQVEDQARSNKPQNYPPGLQVYVPNALAGYNQHLARYHQWELKNEDEVPRLAPLPFVKLEGSG